MTKMFNILKTKAPSIIFPLRSSPYRALC